MSINREESVDFIGKCSESSPIHFNHVSVFNCLCHHGDHYFYHPQGKWSILTMSQVRMEPIKHAPSRNFHVIFQHEYF